MEPEPAGALEEILDGIVYRAVKRAVAEVLAEVLPQLLTAPAESTSILDVPAAAARLGLGTTKTKQLIASGELASVTVGRRRKVPLVAIESYIRTLQEPEQMRLPGS
jgi:excisionase family DNA binding protein